MTRLQNLNPNQDKNRVFENMMFWQEGLANLDYDQVYLALQNGIPASKYVGGLHPLEVLFSRVEEFSQMARAFKESSGVTVQSAAGQDPSAKLADVSGNAQINDVQFNIIDLMISKGMSLLENLRGTEIPVVEAMLGLTDDIMATKLVVSAVKEAISKNTTYEFDIEGLAERFQPKDKENPIEMHNAKVRFKRAAERMDDLHANVRLALVNEDFDMIQDYGDELDFWLEEFPMPTQEQIEAFFPVDQKELKKAIEEQSLRQVQMQAAAQGKAPPPAAKKEEEEKDANSLVQTLEKEELKDILAEIDQYVGMDDFKKNMQALICRVQFDKARKAKGLKVDDQNFHTAFLGNPGTGKTTSAKLKARVLFALGMTGPKYAEVTRDMLVGTHIGKTDDTIKKLIKEVDTLFIDEAYALAEAGGDDKKDFGHRVIEALVAKMGNRKDSFTLFLAGYKQQMTKFLETNEGLSSRVKIFEETPDFTKDELSEILERNLNEFGYKIDEAARTAFMDGVMAEKQRAGQKHFGNARVVVSLVQELPNQMAARLSSGETDWDGMDADTLSTVTVQDVKAALKNREITKEDTQPAHNPVLDRSHPDWQPSIGFGATLLHDRKKQPAMA